VVAGRLGGARQGRALRLPAAQGRLPRLGGGLSLAKHLQGAQLDAAYDYINWYLSGWVGAFLNRQGYYSRCSRRPRPTCLPTNVGFWMEGKPAQGDIKNPQGQVVEKKGAVRDGGSFTERMGAVRLLERGDG